MTTELSAKTIERPTTQLKLRNLDGFNNVLHNQLVYLDLPTAIAKQINIQLGQGIRE